MKTQPGTHSALFFFAIWQTGLFQFFLFIQRWGGSVGRGGAAFADVYAGGSETALNSIESVLRVSKAGQDQCGQFILSSPDAYNVFLLCVCACVCARPEPWQWMITASVLSEGLSLTAHYKSSFTGSWKELSCWNKDGAPGDPGAPGAPGAPVDLLDYRVSLFPPQGTSDFCVSPDKFIVNQTKDFLSAGN